MSKRKPARKTAAKTVSHAPAASSRASTSVKKIDGTRQLIFIGIVIVAALLFFGYVYMTSAAAPESKIQRDGNVMESVQSGEITEVGPSSIPNFPERVKGRE